MEFPTDKQLDEALAEIQGLLNQLEALIKRQSGDATGESGKPSKKDSIARTAIEKAKEALEDRQAIRKPQLEISAVLKTRLEQTIANKANDNVIGEARGQYRAAVKQIDDADKATLSRLDAARKHADKAIKARTGSYTRLAQEAANLQLRQAKKAATRAARQAQEATARQAQDTTARQAQKVVARQVEETTACRAQEDVDLRGYRRMIRFQCCLVVLISLSCNNTVVINDD